MKKKDIIFGFIYFHRARSGCIDYAGPIKYRKVTGLHGDEVDFVEMSSTCDPTGVEGTIKLSSFCAWADGAVDGNMIRQLEELRSRIPGDEARARTVLAAALESINRLGFTVDILTDDEGYPLQFELENFQFDVIPSTQKITALPTTRRMKMATR